MKNVYVPHIEFPGCYCVNCTMSRLQEYRRAAGVDILAIVGCYGVVFVVGMVFGFML